MKNKKHEIEMLSRNEKKKRIALKSDEEIVRETDEMFLKSDNLKKKKEQE